MLGTSCGRLGFRRRRWLLIRRSRTRGVAWVDFTTCAPRLGTAGRDLFGSVSIKRVLEVFGVFRAFLEPRTGRGVLAPHFYGVEPLRSAGGGRRSAAGGVAAAWVAG